MSKNCFEGINTPQVNARSLHSKDAHPWAGWPKVDSQEIDA